MTNGDTQTVEPCIQAPISLAGETPWRDKEVLEALYVDCEWTTRKIAKKLGCGDSTVSEWLRRHDIETRTNKRIEAAAEANRVEYATYAVAGVRGSESIQGMRWENKNPDGTQGKVFVHRLLAISEYGFDAVCGMDVHHKNGIPWDNRPDNIELLSRSEHIRHHADVQNRDAKGDFARGSNGPSCEGPR